MAEALKTVLPESTDTKQSNTSSGASVVSLHASRQRREMSEPELMLTSLLEGCLRENEYSRVMPFHCIDARYKKCPSFMQCFYPLGYGGFAPGPTVGAFGDAVATLCYLTADGSCTARGLPVAVVIGEHVDCGFSKMETGSTSEEVVEARTIERTDAHTLKLLRRSDIAPALRSGRLSVVLTSTVFVREGDGSYSMLYKVLPGRTNRLLEASGQPRLSRRFSERFSERLLVFGNRAAKLGALRRESNG